MTALTDVRTINVPRTAIAALEQHLRAVGRQGHEGLGLWVGVQAGPRFDVRRTLIPAQRHIRTTDGVCVAIGPEELHRLNVWLYKQGLALVAQIHSHPGRAYHSGTDDANAVATAAGSLSLVVPDFASAPFDLATTAVYRLDGAGRWREVRPTGVPLLITVTG